MFLRKSAEPRHERNFVEREVLKCLCSMCVADNVWRSVWLEHHLLDDGDGDRRDYADWGGIVSDYNTYSTYMRQ